MMLKKMADSMNLQSKGKLKDASKKLKGMIDVEDEINKMFNQQSKRGTLKKSKTGIFSNIGNKK